MPTARKLPSGSWRCQAYSHSEPVFDDKGQPIIDPKTKKQKMKRIYKSFTSDNPKPKGKREAEKMASDFAANKELNPRSQESHDMTYGQALDKYIESRSSVLSPGTIREYKRSRKKDLQDLMDYKLSELTQDMIQISINNLALNHSPKTVRNIHGLLSAVFRTYRPSFALNTDLPKRIRADIYVPLDKDIQRLMQHLDGNEMEVPVLLAAFGPMRRGEICALNYEDINGTTIHVRSAITLDENYEWVVKSPKTFTSDRFIEFPQFVIDKIGTGTGRIVNFSANALSSRFNHILLNAGVPHFRFHDLRHYCASIQHALGVPDVYIMQRGGWSSDNVLKNVYRHVMDDKEKEMNDIANIHFQNLCNTNCNTNEQE